MTKLALIKEGKRPIDRRVALTPLQAQLLQQNYPHIQLVVQKSPIRCYSDKEYQEAGIVLQEQVEDCEILIGIKEVPLEELIEGKTYLFFTHTTKKQPYNRSLLQEVLAKNIRLIDYEKLTDPEGNRLLAFGYWAGIVGAYNAIWTWGKRFNLFDLRRANSCFNLEELKKEFSKVQLPPIKIVLTGSGRVAKGAMEILNGLGIKKVSPQEFLSQTFEQPVYAQLRSKDYHYRRSDGGFDTAEFYRKPRLYDSDFTKYTRAADLLIAAAYWNPQAPVLFSKEEIGKESFRIKVIADITCDIQGSIPSTVRAGSIADPLYDYNPDTDTAVAPLSDEKNLTVMAIDNLPCELARDASEDFGRQLMANVMPALLDQDSQHMIRQATIAENGTLNPEYQYLQAYVEGRE
jgi:saccharopine dehydrogenase (NAD+, L-lysine-forming)